MESKSRAESFHRLSYSTKCIDILSGNSPELGNSGVILISVFPAIMSLMKAIRNTGLDLLNYLLRLYEVGQYPDGRWFRNS